MTVQLFEEFEEFEEFKMFEEFEMFEEFGFWTFGFWVLGFGIYRYACGVPASFLAVRVQLPAAFKGSIACGVQGIEEFSCAELAALG